LLQHFAKALSILGFIRQSLIDLLSDIAFGIFFEIVELLVELADKAGEKVLLMACDFFHEYFHCQVF
jgi:hypothetical protein